MKTLIWLIATIMVLVVFVIGLGVNLELVLGIIATIIFIMILGILVLPETNNIRKFLQKIL